MNEFSEDKLIEQTAINPSSGTLQGSVHCGAGIFGEVYRNCLKCV